MGTARNAAEFSKKITDLATVTQQKSKAVVEQGALVAKEIMVGEAAAAGLTPGSKIAGAKWGVRYDVKGFNNPTALLRFQGPVHLVNNDTRSHKIYRRVDRAKGRGSSKINKQAKFDQVFGGRGAYKGGSLKLANGNFRKVVNHPGTSGKHFFEKGRAKADKAVPVVMGRRLVGFWQGALK